MKFPIARILALAATLVVSSSAQAEGMMAHDMAMKHAAPMAAVEDARPLVDLKPETINLLRADMRSMMAAFTRVLALIGEGKRKEAAEVLENDLGMSAMATHPGMMRASQELPENVRMLGMEMHQAASRLAKDIGKLKPAAVDRGLSEISAGCVACHMAYRVR